MSYPLIWSSMETKKCLRKEKFNVSSDFIIEMTHMGYEISGPFHKEIHHPLTKTFCKQQCDWLINRGWGKFITLWHIQHPTEPAEFPHPLGVLNSAPYRACWKCFLKQKIHHCLVPKGDEANSAGCRRWWIPFWNGPKVGITRKFKLALFKLRGNSCIL